MLRRLKTVSLTDQLLQFLYFILPEFDNPATIQTDQVVMMRVPEDMFIVGVVLAAQGLLNQPTFD